MTEQQGAPAAPEQPHFGRWMGSMWLYTILRFGLFGVLWLVLWLVGLSGYVAALIALVLSVPLSFVLLARPRAAFGRQLEARMALRNRAQADLADQLDPDAETRDALPSDDDAALAELREAEARRARARSAGKSRRDR